MAIQPTEPQSLPQQEVADPGAIEALSLDKNSKYVPPLPSFAQPILPTQEQGQATGTFQQPMIQASVTMSAARLPFIPPDLIIEYNEAYPGLVDKLLIWTEAQQNHRMELETLRTQRSERRQDRAQTGAVIVAAGGLIIAGAVGIGGSAMAASIIAIVAVGGPVAATLLAGRFGSSENTPLPQLPKPNTKPADDNFGANDRQPKP